MSMKITQEYMDEYVLKRLAEIEKKVDSLTAKVDAVNFNLKQPATNQKKVK